MRSGSEKLAREMDPNAAPLLKTASLTSNGQDIAVGLITNIGANKVQDFRIHNLPSHVRLSAFLQGADFNAANGIQGFAGLQRPGTVSSFPDYSFSGYAALRSGIPYTPIVSTDRANTGVASQRPNIIPAGGSPTLHKSLTSWFDKTAYVVAPALTC
jgi:hypothetical protein